MNTAFFFQTQQIPDSSSIFDQLKNQQIFFSYFQVDQKYYLFFYSQKSIDIHFLYQSVNVIQELDSKQRKIRSLRGFFLYALETIQNADNYEILKTNLQPFFWKKVHNIIRQNKKGALQEFLFGKDTDTNHDTTGSNPALPELQNQVDSLAQQVEKFQQKVIQLEARVQHNPEDLLSEASQPLEPSKTTHQEYCTFQVEKGPYLIENDNQIKKEPILQAQHKPNKISEAAKIDFKNDEPIQDIIHLQIKMKPKIW